MKIWAKVIKEDKILLDTVMEFNRQLSYNNFVKSLNEICLKLDIPTPITLNYHYKCFDEFNSVKYLAEEFIERVDFTSLVLENCIEK
ncbi:MAG: hypothetical protein ACOX3U_06490 [Christensenellales bacterium]